MIRLKNVNKSFDNIKAIDNISVTLKDGLILGLVGTNGAGKSTMLRLISGVLKPDSGQIFVDDKETYDNPKVKEDICFLSDTAYFFPNSTPEIMRDFYALNYPKFDKKLFDELLSKTGLEPKRKINTFSKGMKKQLSILLGVATQTRYLLMDETFDGLDPVVRQAVKGLFASELLNRDFTPVIASHNLRELEDICDSVGLVYNGQFIFNEELDSLKVNAHKIQCVIENPADEHKLLEGLDILTYDRQGQLMIITARGTEEALLSYVNKFSPVFAEILPLSLEEIFISETEAAGYDIKDFLQ